ncbi:MAG: hypothetical protein KGJ23_08420 [Euryarchaeota archaeon]|nr:hypothetical protein [Euryarchaeota archaeon]MDE1836626.1 hypothetical protein [Euryarchaeota archaeon]MDE1879179.1 hypothetical protein [Euryarchaeota archaeon]MDE2044596.1 hypothetical protein [Thermoplasmata archaeon]
MPPAPPPAPLPAPIIAPPPAPVNPARPPTPPPRPVPPPAQTPSQPPAPPDLDATLGTDDKWLSFDPQRRPVHLFSFYCPCGRRSHIFVSMTAQFSFPNHFPEGTKPTRDLNVWFARVDGDRLSISPSIGLQQVDGHSNTEKCHLVLTNIPFRWDKPDSAG